MNLKEHQAMEENQGVGESILENFLAILCDNGSDMTASALYRSIYKANACGPWLSVRLHDGSVVHCDKLGTVENANVRALLVGSIVEGSDAEVTAGWIDLLACTSPEDAVERFNRTVEWVNEEACAIFDEGETE